MHDAWVCMYNDTGPQGQAAGSTFRAECQLREPSAVVLYDSPLACVVPFVTGNATLRVTLQGPFETAQGVKASLTCNATSLFVAPGAVLNGTSAAVFGNHDRRCPCVHRRHAARVEGEVIGASAVGYILKGQSNWVVSGSGWSPLLGASALIQV